MPSPLTTLARRTAAPALIAFLVLLVLVAVRWSPLHTLDLDVADDLNDLTAPHPDAVHWWKLVSEVGQPATFQTLSVLAAIALWVRGRAAIAVFTAATVLSAGVLSTVTKLLVGRDRPTVDTPIAHAAGTSFPSGHAMASFVGVAVLLVLVAPRTSGRRRVALVVAGAAVAGVVASSRLALGVHYVSDVLGGWLLGLVWVCLAVVLLDAAEGRVSPRPRRVPVPPCPGPPP